MTKRPGGGGGGARSHTKDVPWFLPSFVTFAESKIIWKAKHGQGQCNAPQQSLKMQRKCNMSSMDRTKAAELTNIALCLAKASNLDVGSAFYTCSDFMDEEPEGCTNAHRMQAGKKSCIVVVSNHLYHSTI